MLQDVSCYKMWIAIPWKVPQLSRQSRTPQTPEALGSSTQQPYLPCCLVDSGRGICTWRCVERQTKHETPWLSTEGTHQLIKHTMPTRLQGEMMAMSSWAAASIFSVNTRARQLLNGCASQLL